MQSIKTCKIGQSHGSPRIWLEGKQPARAGFEPGTRYSIEIVHEKNMVALKVAEGGSRIVSRKERNGTEVPIIDINSHELLGLFAGMEAIRVIMQEGTIFLLPLATEARKKERKDRLSEKLATGSAIAVGSLSHGGGVLSNAIHVGLKNAGVESYLAFANDIDVELLEHAQAHNEIWSEKTQFLGMPMQELAFDEYAASKLQKVEVLEAGIPCTAHSVAARAKKGKDQSLPEDDPNVGHLAVAFLAIIARVNPAVIVLENVVPYLSSSSMSIIRNQLHDMGYQTHERVLVASEWNCLEARQRMCMVAVTDGMLFDFDSLLIPEKIERKLGEILDPVAEDADCWSAMDYLKVKETRDAAKGNSFAMQVFDAESNHINTLRKGYHKNGSSDPKIVHPSNPDLLRLLNQFEHARCKDIPEHLVAGMSKTAAHELLGQSIAYPPFVAVGRLVGQSLKGAFKASAAQSVQTPDGQMHLLAA